MMKQLPLGLPDIGSPTRLKELLKTVYIPGEKAHLIILRDCSIIQIIDELLAFSC